MANSNLPDFGAIGFSGKLRSQAAAVSIIKPQLDLNEKDFTLLLHRGQERRFLASTLGQSGVRAPTLVLSPNSAIQAQWAARTSLFDLDGKEDQISTDPKNPGLLTSLTYQSVTMPKRGGEDLDVTALNSGQKYR